MTNIFFKHRNLLIWTGLVFLGSAGGYLFYYYVGCETGLCPISSKPANSVLWGAFLGAVGGFPGLELWYRERIKK